MLKFFFDFFISLILIVIFSPFLFIISFIVLINSGFPIIHKRTVHSSPKKCFNFYKFRTMYTDADDRLDKLLKDPIYKEEYDKFSKLKNDPRITKVGKFLRKTSMDELPQLINVLFGQMSLVGPRPKTSYELEKYYSNDEIEKIFTVKPGITGIQQISGRANLEYHERIKMELKYIDDKNFIYDFIILIKTPFSLFKDGVY